MDPSDRAANSGWDPHLPEVAGPLPRDVVRAIAWLREHPDEPIAISELAALAGVRPRTLESHFKRFVGTTPRGLVRRMRLANARRQLLDPRNESTVTDIALASGFTQAGRFALQYRAQYGELPSQALRRARAASERNGLPFDDEALRLSWRALPAAFAVAPAECAVALDHAAEAQAVAPGYALPKAIAAWCMRQRLAQGFRSARAEDDVVSRELAREACALAPHDALVLTLSASALTLARRLEEADQLVERALSIDPWSAWAWLRRGWLSAYQGDADAAISELQLTLQFMPFEPIRHLACIGIGGAHFAAGRYERAARWIHDGVDASPGSFWASRILAASAAHSGARAHARRVVRDILRRDPALTVDEAREAWPFPAEVMERLCDGLVLAGLPRS